MAEIVQGLFGLSPSQIMQDRYDTGYAQDLRAVQLSPMQQANLALRQGGRGIAQGVVAPLLGVQDQDLQKAQMAQQLAANFDITTPEGLTEYAKALAQNGMPEFAQIAVSKAQDMKTKGLSIEQSQLNIKKTQQTTDREELLREALAALPAAATDEDYIKIYRQFGSPDQQARIIEAGINARAKLASEGGTGPGSVGKTGAYRDMYGTVYGGAEMKPIRQEFEQGQRLLETLNKVTPKDIKDAESYIDYTDSSNIVKGIAKDKTLAAQTKIAANQLLAQIESLPPGSASDKDMRAAMKDFPGYTNPEALRQWVNRTKAKLQSNLEAQAEQFGFKQRITSTGDLSFNTKPATVQTKPSTTDDALINKYLK